MTLRFLFLIAIGVLAACSAEQSSQSTASAPTATSSPISSQIPIPATFTEAKPEDIYQQYAWLNRRVQAQLAHVNTAQANQLYDEYHRQSDEIVQLINTQEADFLKNYVADDYWLIDDSASMPKPSPLLQQKQQQLEKVGLRYVDIGEGMAEIAPLQNTETRLFADKVSPDYRDFIQQQDHENNQLADMDAAVVVSWTELGKRVVFWENFIRQYPQSNFISEAKQRLEWYRELFLFGLDNTPVEEGMQVFQGETRSEAIRIFDEISHAWTVFERQYPESSVSQYIPEARIIATLPEHERLAAIEEWQKRVATAASEPK